jgi:heat shock protein HtpX
MSMVMLIVMNLAVMVSLYIVLFILGAFFGININSSSMLGIFAMSALFGFGGSFFSLFMSKSMAIKGMNVRIIEHPSTEFERWLVNTIARQAKDAGLGMPDVGIFDAPPNAFATGRDRNNALVAVSTGLIELMNKDEISGVLAHEMTHVKNGDMITMTLMQGVINTFVMFASRVIAGLLSRNNNRGGGASYYMISLVLNVVFSFLANIVLMWYSRVREYKADEGAVDLDGANNIYYALAKLGNIPQEQLSLNDDYKTFGFVGFLGDILRTHPQIEQRLENIKKYSKR